MSKGFKRTSVLYFIAGVLPTAAQSAQIEEMLNDGLDVRQRNAMLVSEGESLESFDAIGGNAPAKYVEAAEALDKPIYSAPEEPEEPAQNGDQAPAGGKGNKGGGKAPEGPAAAPGAAPGWTPNGGPAAA